MSAQGPTQGPLTQMALALQARDQQFQARLTQAMYMAGMNPVGALSEFTWAEQEYPALEQQRSAFDAATDQARVQMGTAMTPQEVAMRNDMANMSHNTWFQIQCGKAQALMVLKRFPEARAVVDNGFRFLTPQTGPQARSMLLQLRSSLLAATGPGL